MRYLLLLDRYHLDDPLFAGALARMLARPGRPPCLLVHGGGDAAERQFEAAGVFPERQGGVLVPKTAAEVAVVERAVRELNRKLVATLTDAVVHAVGLQGADRGLLRPEDDTLTAGRVTWIQALLERGVVPVVSALVAVEGSVREVSAVAAARALAAALGPPLTVVVFTKTNRPGFIDASGARAEVPCAALSGEVVDDPAAVCALVAAGLPVLLTSVAGLGGAEGVQGTHVTS